MSSFNLQQHEIAVEKIHRNLAPSALYEHAILYEKDAHIAENGALVAYSGVKTRRSPKDKRVVKQTPSENDVWWGKVNIPLDTHTFAIIRERVRDYLNSREHLYCFDGFAGWDPKYRIKVRVICSRPYHAYEAAAKKLASLFVNNFATYEGESVPK
jgi:phosphoenolpyruvate carboxykinase (ATP)